LHLRKNQTGIGTGTFIDFPEQAAVHEFVPPFRYNRNSINSGGNLMKYRASRLLQGALVPIPDKNRPDVRKLPRQADRSKTEFPAF
jgi:hypothetical protein